MSVVLPTVTLGLLVMVLTVPVVGADPAHAQQEATTTQVGTTQGGQEGGQGQEEETGTTAPARQPAVTTIPQEEVPPEDAWTYRYLVPTALVLGVVTSLAIIVAYFLKVTRSRYRVVE
ncbi:MAG: hypothetical protein M3N51_05660 [Actinomycetota bacterium]|nr:hypothetical protein [Actinomycetota bacterium]